VAQQVSQASTIMDCVPMVEAVERECGETTGASTGRQRFFSQENLGGDGAAGDRRLRAGFASGTGV